MPAEYVYMIRGPLDLLSAPAVVHDLDIACGSDERTDLILDVSNMSYMDSSGLAAIIHAHNRSREHGHHVVIRGAHPTTVRLLEATGLSEVLEIDE